MSSGWSLYVIVLAVSNVVASAWLLLWARRKRVEEGKPETLGDTYDGIEEYDSPLPRWWLWMFIGTIAFSVVYFALYPGLGNFAGLLGWSQRGQYDAEVREAQAEFGPIYAAYTAKPIEEVARDPKALRIGERLFANNCTSCHGADAQGGVGYPNLTDNDWLFGGDPQTIKTTILNGRMGVMPAFAPALGGEEHVQNVIQYVLSLSGRPVDPVKAEAGKQKYMAICIACHGPEGKGNQAIGAPNLTDNIWLFGGTPQAIEEGLRRGRMGKMPAHGEILGEERVHLLAAYVYSLSHQGEGAAR
jgi:cytochrome c oxidase cbb3-type subunit 3